MQDFFHADTKKYIHRRKYLLVFIDAPLLMLGVLGFLTMILNFRQMSDENFFSREVVIVLGTAFIALNLSWLVWEIFSHLIKTRSRYTYFDIEVKDMIFSKYSGCYRHLGHKYIQRKLYIIPVETLKEVTYNPLNKIITLTGEIRCYSLDSQRSGYHIHKGKVEFDNWWLNENGFIKLTKLELPKAFARPKTLAKSIRIAQKRFEYLPAPKKLVIKSPVVMRKKTSKRHKANVELPTFDRNW